MCVHTRSWRPSPGRRRWIIETRHGPVVEIVIEPHGDSRTLVVVAAYPVE
jgi:hypothetical protein